MAVSNDDLVASAPHKPCGFAQYTVLTALVRLEDAPSTGKSLSQLKGKPMRALIQAEAQPIRWTDDPDVDPTTAIGMLIPVNTVLEYDGDLSKFRMIEDAAGAIANISYYNM